ncbi:MAG: hypothetical protein ABL921_15135 [Pirellula sp.]
MPIRVTCQCGHSLAVPDQMAGKAGKCPKCQQIIKIPVASSAQANPAAQKNSGAASKPPQPAKPPQPMAIAPSALEGLFEAAGLEKKKGNLCPSCETPIQRGSILCVKCGLNFQEGTQLTGFQAEEKKEFGNKRLNEAARMMAREADTETRLLNTGQPWWMLFATLAGVLVFIAGAAVKMDAATTGKKSNVEIVSRIQSASMFTVLCASAGAACMLIATFSLWAILFTAFFESIKQGLLCFFIPLYIFYYMFSRIKSQSLVSTVSLYWTTTIIGILLLGYSLPKI